MKKFLVKSPAKINIALNITGRRESDGYHYLDSIVLPVSLHDSLLFTELGKGEDNNVTIDDYTFGAIRFNIVSQALERLLKAGNVDNAFKVLIHKVIPMQAGLGGGSSNAASTLKTINNYLKLNLPEEKLLEIGLNLGADVPFFLKGVPARCRGVGEIVEPIKVKNDYYALIVKPEKGCSTNEVYGSCDQYDLKTCDIDAVIKALETGDDELLANSISNALLEPALQFVPEIEHLIKQLKDAGLKIVSMTGSGSAVFALSTDLKLLKKIGNKFLDHYLYEIAKVIKGA